MSIADTRSAGGWPAAPGDKRRLSAAVSAAPAGNSCASGDPGAATTMQNEAAAAASTDDATSHVTPFAASTRRNCSAALCTGLLDAAVLPGSTMSRKHCDRAARACCDRPQAVAAPASFRKFLRSILEMPSDFISYDRVFTRRAAGL